MSHLGSFRLQIHSICIKSKRRTPNLALLVLGMLVALLASHGSAPAQTPAHSPSKGPQLTPKHTLAVAPTTFVLAESDRHSIEQLLIEAHAQTSPVARMRLISTRLLGLPYLTHSLIGAPGVPEQFVARMDGFDCVTFVETVLALSRATSVEDYLNRLRELRYANGEVAYASRLHYSTDWKKANVQRGVLQDVPLSVPTVEMTKTFGPAVGLPPRTVQIRYYPKSAFGALTTSLRDGDVIFFVSGRQALDTNHMGLVFREGDRLLLRHASRSHAQVTEQLLSDFVNTNQMVGFIIARPQSRAVNP